jgi:hypothetical protein
MLLPVRVMDLESCSTGPFKDYGIHENSLAIDVPEWLPIQVLTRHIT